MASALNQLELRSAIRFPLLGSWCARKEEVSFVCFYPKYLYQPGVVTNLAGHMISRARWVAEDLYGDNWSESRAKSATERLISAGGERGSIR